MQMTTSLFPELLASYEAALGAAKRSLAIARALADGHRAGVRPPEDIVEAYIVRLDRDEARVKELHKKVAEFKSAVRME